MTRRRRSAKAKADGLMSSASVKARSRSHHASSRFATPQPLSESGRTGTQDKELASTAEVDASTHSLQPRQPLQLPALSHRSGSDDSGFSSVVEVVDRASLVQQLQQLLPQPQPQPPSLELAEQPAQFYRFRYESEVARSRVGGLLLGRGASDSSKSFMRLRVAGIEPHLHSQLQLRVCTVNSEDMAPHPYYLYGNSCHQGFFEETKTVDESTAALWEISFSKLAVICVPKKRQEDIKAGLNARLKNVPELHDCPGAPSVPYDSRNLGKIRLAFSLGYTDSAGTSWVLPTIFSDEIQGGKEKKQLELDSVNPTYVILDGSVPEIAIYTCNPTTGFVKCNCHVLFTDIETKKVWARCPVKEMRKHLLTVQTPNAALSSGSERLKCYISVCYSEFQSNKVDIVFLPSRGPTGVSRKRPSSWD